MLLHVSVFLLLSPLCKASDRFALTLLSSLRCFISHMHTHIHNCAHSYDRHVYVGNKSSSWLEKHFLLFTL